MSILCPQHNFSIFWEFVHTFQGISVVTNTMPSFHHDTIVCLQLFLGFKAKATCCILKLNWQSNRRQYPFYCYPPIIPTHHNFVIDIVCEGQVFILRLHRKRVGVEPLQKWQVQSCACVAVLGCMDVCIHESWHNELTIKRNHHSNSSDSDVTRNK